MQTTILKNEVKDGDDIEEVKFAVTNRMSRATNGIAVPFSMVDPVPSLPNDSVKDIITTITLITQDDLDEVKKLFKERPIWTLASLRAHMKLPPKRLNYILAGVAFYYSTGPWRNCFVRLGFDPKKNFESRYYQMLDYRVRQGAGFKEEVTKRRPAGVNRRVKVHSKDFGAVKEESQIEQDYHRRRIEAIFTLDTIPPFRARHYQFIDIHVPKIQEMLQKIPSPFSGVLCNEKRGWLPVGFMEMCRDILTDIAQSNMMKHCREKNISLEEFRATEDIISEAPTGEDEDQDSDDSDIPFPEDMDDNQGLAEQSL
jgi:general transcription factor 3C polypeptide 5 (transcription factor C subunit 1)